MARNDALLSKAQLDALSRFAADLTSVDIRSATVRNLIGRGYLALEPVPANNGLYRPVITQTGRDAAFAALAAT